MSHAALPNTVRPFPETSLRRLSPEGYLLESGLIGATDLMTALAEAGRSGATPLEALVAEGTLSASDIADCEALRLGLRRLDRVAVPPDPEISMLLPPDFCIRHDVLPWMRIGQTVVLATARPRDFAVMRADLPPHFPPVVMALTTQEDIHQEISLRHGAALARQAENWVAQEDSCRDLGTATGRRTALAALTAVGGLAFVATAPALFFAIATLLAAATLLVAQVLKVAAFVALLRDPPKPAGVDNPDLGHYPKITLLVPLLKEKEIAGALLRRLSSLAYPKAQLEVLLILEEADDQTREALARATLPNWMRVIEVPKGRIQTKPRALNYAYRFARGDIIGIYDAEDAPAPDQLNRVAAEFQRAPQDVACLQGILDYYNPRANWLSRCFTIEYAVWFRVLLPGLARLGLAIPLGGTTVFFRRAALDKVRGWDAHNVTEDADLGIRLARYGYRTRLIPTVTREEANNRAWPWIKQRSRWLKGYMVTWIVHARNPRRLWQQLGPKRFFGFHALFLTSLAQFLLAPSLWLFWLVLFGLPHPASDWFGPSGLTLLISFFLACEAVALLIGFSAVARTRHSRLAPWVLTLFLYFPLGCIAAYKGLIELVFRPFFWDKTAHGHSMSRARKAV